MKPLHALLSLLATALVPRGQAGWITAWLLWRAGRRQVLGVGAGR